MTRWRGIASSDPALRPVALRWLAAQAMRSHDTARADSLWEEAARAFPLWAPAAIRARADLALERGDGTKAESLLASADLPTWTDAEHADVLARRAALRFARGDVAPAIELAQQAMLRFPATAAAARAVTLLERARGGPTHLPVGEVRAAAEVEALHGQRLAAAQRLDRRFAATRDPDRWRLELRAAELLRADRRYGDALARLGRARAATASPAARDRVALERARAERDAGASDAALAGFRALAASGEADVRAAAAWERARELESRGKWEPAYHAYAEVARRDDSRRGAAAYRAGITAIAAGSLADSALAWLGGDDEPARYFRAQLLRTRALMLADTTLRGIARTAGYTTYRIDSREQLGLPGWPGAVAAAETLSGTLATARELLDLDLADDAVALLDRWSAGDPRLQAPLGPGPPLTPAALVAAAALVNGSGRYAVGIRLAQQALDACPPGDAAGRWAVAPWLYPPLFAAEVAAAGLDPDLLRAVMWQESKFNPEARSRSNALGLFQLKDATAGDVARWLGERRPSDADLFDPARSVRYGARYLEHLLERFRGDTLLAIAAYNAGPGAIEQWLRVRTWRDPALDGELIARPETEDYVKKILSVRRGYREMRPVSK